MPCILSIVVNLKATEVKEKKKERKKFAGWKIAIMGLMAAATPDFLPSGRKRGMR